MLYIFGFSGVAADLVAHTLFLDSAVGNCSWELSDGIISSLFSYLILTSVQVDATTFILGGHSRYEFEFKTLSSTCDILLLKDTMEHVRTIAISNFLWS